MRTVFGTNDLTVAHHGLILSKDGAPSLRNNLKYLQGLQYTTLMTKTTNT